MDYILHLSLFGYDETHAEGAFHDDLFEEVPKFAGGSIIIPKARIDFRVIGSVDAYAPDLVDEGLVTRVVPTGERRHE